MFIRKKLNASGSTTVQVLYKFRGKNHIIMTIGTSKEPDEIEKFYQKAQEAVPTLFDQLLLFPEPKSAKAQLVGEIGNDDIRICGPYVVFGRIFDSLNFNQITDSLFRDLVISRITHPGSKLRLKEFLEKTGRQSISVDSIYRFMDKEQKI